MEYIFELIKYNLKYLVKNKWCCVIEKVKQNAKQKQNFRAKTSFVNITATINYKSTNHK
jgi:hypothetical protein